MSGNIISINKYLTEKCGVIGVWCGENFATYYVRKGLSTLQHRGQESAGISIFDQSENKIRTYKGMGLVPSVLKAEALKALGESLCAIGHNRYSTAGSSSECNAQPITIKKGRFQISIGHNGNIPDFEYLGEYLDEKNMENETSDTPVVAKLLLQERSKYKDWDDTLKNVLPLIRGAFCFVIMTEDGAIYGTRDPYGIRPFCLGKLDNGWIMASESVAIDLNHGEFMRDIKPGEIVKISYDGNLSSLFFGEPKRPQNCIFEYIYFSRPDSFENGLRVRYGREKSGRFLAQRIMKKKIKAHAVVPVFDSGFPAAKGTAMELGLPMVDAITVSHYIGRTFIQPGHENRMAAVNGKHNIIPDEIMGKSIIVVDDSAVRLTTSRRLCRELKNAGARNVYMVFASPPVVSQCDMGINMRTKKELPAGQWENEPFEVIEKNVAETIGADGVVYLPIEETASAFGGKKDKFYHYPFGGPHPLRDKQYEFPKKRRKIKSKAKLAVFISRRGMNLQEIIRQINNGDIEAGVTAVISSKPDSNGLKVAEENNVQTFIIPYEGDINDKVKRKEYDKQLFEVVRKSGADIIVLAGWTFVLGDEFLKSAEALEVPVLNLHPALLTDDFEERAATSRGIIPVIRGTAAIREAFDKKLPVSGVTVHQILPKKYFDTGPVVLKEEVRLNKEDTLESFEKKIHETEYRVLPTAIKRVIHVMKEGVDVSRGDFFW